MHAVRGAGTTGAEETATPTALCLRVEAGAACALCYNTSISHVHHLVLILNNVML